MYLEHFQLEKQPFDLTPGTEFFCKLSGHQNVLNTILFCLSTGEGCIKVIGEVGSGKTLLCRKLLNTLDESFCTVYLPSPDLEPVELKITLAHEFGLVISTPVDPAMLTQRIFERLLQLHQAGKKVVVIIDEAQVLPDKSLETLRLLTNFETESKKLLQLVLFAQPELGERLNQHHLRQLNQRITFSSFLPTLTRDELEEYIYHRLSVAGYRRGLLFDRKVVDLIHRHSGGVPRIANILCHKSLLAAYGLGEQKISKKAFRRAAEDSRNVLSTQRDQPTYFLVMVLAILLLCSIGMIAWDFIHYRV